MGCDSDCPNTGGGDHQQQSQTPDTSQANDFLSNAENIEIDGHNPDGPPRAVRQPSGRINIAAAATIVLIAGGTTTHFFGGNVSSCRGATKSAQLQWHQRRAEIERVVSEIEAANNVHDGPAEPEADSSGNFRES